MTIDENGEFQAFLEAMLGLLSMRDPYTAVHQVRVANLARDMAWVLWHDADQSESIRLAAMVHDLGKVAIPAEILVRPGRLSTWEFSLVQRHPQDGYEVLGRIAFPWPVAQVALQHHERMDGSGYPQGLKGDAISLAARVVAVADVMEAMTSHRPFRPALPLKVATDTLEAGSGTRFDPFAVRACLDVVGGGGYEFA